MEKNISDNDGGKNELGSKEHGINNQTILSIGGIAGLPDHVVPSGGYETDDDASDRQPAYIARHGHEQTPSDIWQHTCECQNYLRPYVFSPHVVYNLLFALGLAAFIFSGGFTLSTSAITSLNGRDISPGRPPHFPRCHSR